MKLYVLAAGYATRMYPLTRERAKPLLEIGDRPLLSRILERFCDLPELEQIVVISNERFVERFRDWAATYDCPVPIQVLSDGSTEESNRLGAVGDLQFALREVPPGDSPWTVIAGDNLIDFDPGPAWREFLARGRPLLLVRSVDDPNELRPYNEITLDADGTVTAMREKPQDPTGRLAAIALYFFTPGVAQLLERYLSDGGNPDAPGHFVQWLIRETPVGAARFDGSWFDIGSLETLEVARKTYGG